MISDPQGQILDSKDYLAPIITPFEAMLAFSPGSEWDERRYRLDFDGLLVGAAAASLVYTCKYVPRQMHALVAWSSHRSMGHGEGLGACAPWAAACVINRLQAPYSGALRMNIHVGTDYECCLLRRRRRQLPPGRAMSWAASPCWMGRSTPQRRLRTPRATRLHQQQQEQQRRPWRWRSKPRQRCRSPLRQVAGRIWWRPSRPRTTSCTSAATWAWRRPWWARRIRRWSRRPRGSRAGRPGTARRAAEREEGRCLSILPSGSWLWHHGLRAGLAQQVHGLSAIPRSFSF
jgi:hypothetical protein